MTNGNKASRLILDILNKNNLTLIQKADVEASKGGKYEPESVYDTLLEVADLVEANNIPELIKLYKLLPQTKPLNNDTADYLTLPHSKELSMARLDQPQTLVGTVLESREYRLNNLYTIIDKNHSVGILKLNKAQQALLRAQDEHPRVLVLKSRQRGLTTYAIIDALDTLLTTPHLIRGLQAADLKSASAIMRKAKLAYEAIPLSLKPSIVVNNTLDISFSNGSKLSISTSFRGETISGLHISELGRISLNPEKASELRSGTLQALPANEKTRVVGESTSEGPQNMFSKMYNDALENYQVGNYKTFKPLFIGWLGIIEDGKLIPDTADEDCVLPINHETEIPSLVNDWLIAAQNSYNIQLSDEQVEWAVATYKELNSDIVELKREYPISPEDAFVGGSEGLIFNHAIQRHATINNSLHRDNSLPIYAAADLGVGDTFVVVLFQLVKGRMRIVDYIADTGQPLRYYVQYIMANDVAHAYFPHDTQQRELQTSKKRKTAIRDIGLKNFTVMKRSQDLWASVDRVRSYMPNMEFGHGTSELVTQLLSYRKKWNSQLGMYEDKPYHNDASNYADAIRYAVDAVLDYLYR